MNQGILDFGELGEKIRQSLPDHLTVVLTVLPDGSVRSYWSDMNLTATFRDWHAVLPCVFHPLNRPTELKVRVRV